MEQNVRYVLQGGSTPVLRSETTRTADYAQAGHYLEANQTHYSNHSISASGNNGSQSFYGGRFAAYRENYREAAQVLHETKYSSSSTPVSSPKLLHTSNPQGISVIPQANNTNTIPTLLGHQDVSSRHGTRSLASSGSWNYQTNDPSPGISTTGSHIVSSSKMPQYFHETYQRELGTHQQRELTTAPHPEIARSSFKDEKVDVLLQNLSAPSLTMRQTVANVFPASSTTSPLESSETSTESMTPRMQEVEIERTSSREKPSSRSMDYPAVTEKTEKRSLDPTPSSGDIERASAAKLSSEISNLIKERERNRNQDLTSNNFSSGVLSDLSRQNNEIMKERDLLRTQFEEVSNRYQVLQRSLKVIDEQAAAEHEKCELANKKLKDAEANAISLQNHHQVLARENQLLKEQLGKVLRLNEAEKVELQNKSQTLETQLSNLRLEKSDFEQQVSSMSQKIQSNEGQIKSREDVLKATSYTLERKQRCMQRAAAVFFDRKLANVCFRSWQALWKFRRTQLCKYTAKSNELLEKAILDEWARVCRLEGAEKRMQSDHVVLKNDFDNKLEQAAKLFGDKEQDLLTLIEVLKTDFASKEESLLQNVRKTQDLSDSWLIQVEAKHAEERESIKKESESRAVVFKAESAKLIAEKDLQWSGKLESLSVSHRIEMSELTVRYERMQDEQESKWARQLEEAAAEYDRAITSLRTKYESGISEKEAESQKMLNECLLKQESELSLLKSNFDASQMEKDDQWAKKLSSAMTSHEQEKSSLTSQFQESMAQKEAQWVQKFEDACSLQEVEISSLTTRFEGIHAELREKLLGTRTAANAQVEQLRLEQSKSDREWRQKLIDKERALAAHLEEIERQRMQSIEDIQKELQVKEREWVTKMDAMRAENARTQEEWRTKLLLKEKDFASKMEMAREANIKGQEEFQNELQVRETEFKRILERKESDCQALLDAHLSKSSHATVELLQSKISLHEAALKDKEIQIRDIRAEKMKLQNELHSSLTKEQSLRTGLEELRTVTDQSAAVKCTEMDKSLERIALLEKALKVAEHNSEVEKQKASTLSLELEAATQVLIKRGEDFNQSIKALEAIVQSKDAELNYAKETSKSLNVTNAALVQEVDSSSSASISYKTSIATLQQELDAAHSQNRTLAEDWETRYRALEASFESRLESVTSQEEHDGSLQQQLLQAEAELDHIRRLLGGLEQENSTLSNELDNVLLENAQLRHRIDSIQFSDEGQRLHDSQSEEDNLKKNLWGHSPGTRTVRTYGVHTLRLRQHAFHAWSQAIREMRMWGKNPMFSCLDYLMTADGCVASWLPVGRLRKTDFEIKNEKIGSGTFAEVMRGEIIIPCAVKRIKGPVQQKELLEFIREGEMMRAASHPSIIKLLGIHSEGGQYHLLQEYAAGPNLFDFVHKLQKTVPIARQLSMAVQICDALIHLHDLRIVHRDVKTQNIIYMEKSGTVKLCDFGLARLMPFGMSLMDPKHVGTGGTPAYQGPEVLKRHPIGMKLDLYGFAISFWELNTGKLPWSDCSLDQMTVRVAIQKERPKIPLDMPREYADIITRCWHDDPNMRPEFSEILRPLKEIHDSLNPSARLTMSAASNANTIFGSRGSAGPELLNFRGVQQLLPMQQPFSSNLQPFTNMQPSFSNLQPPVQSPQSQQAPRFSAQIAQF